MVQDLPPRNNTAEDQEEDEGVLPTGEVEGADVQAVAVIGGLRELTCRLWRS